MTRFALGVCALSLLTVSLTAFAQQNDERAGTCEDAKSQVDYFCGGSGNPNDMMMQLTACDNAKKNMAAACEGKVEADQEYKFDK